MMDALLLPGIEPMHVRNWTDDDRAKITLMRNSGSSFDARPHQVRAQFYNGRPPTMPDRLSYVPMARIADMVVRPGIDKHLIPLCLYKGTISFGRVHRWWNFALAAMEQGAESLSDVVKLSHHPEFSQLCGPTAKQQYSGAMGFFNRLRDNPQVTDNIPGMTEWAREVLPHYWAYQRVPLETYEKDAAEWRLLVPTPFQVALAARREDEARRRADREAERALRRGERDEAEAIYREGVEQRRFERAERREHARQEAEANRAQRVIEREMRRFQKAQREKLEAERRGAPLLSCYPYIAHDARKSDGADLVALVNKAVPRGIDESLRADICQDVICAILLGDMKREDLSGGVKEFIRAGKKMFADRWRFVSMAAPIGDGDTVVGDLI